MNGLGGAHSQPEASCGCTPDLVKLFCKRYSRQELIESYGQGSMYMYTVTPYTTNTRAKFKHGVQCYYVYSWLHHSYAQQGYTKLAATPSSYVKLLR